MTVLLWIVYAVFGIAAVLTVVRIILGPSILDRAVAADVLLTEVLCVLGADMVIDHHTDTLPVLLIVAAVGVFGSVAIARFVARKDTDAPDAGDPNSDGPDGGLDADGGPGADGPDAVAAADDTPNVDAVDADASGSDRSAASGAVASGLAASGLAASGLAATGPVTSASLASGAPASGAEGTDR